MPTGRRLIRMSGRALAHLLAPGRHAYEVIDGIPPDARVVRVAADHTLRTEDVDLVIVVESPSFDESPEGMRVPELVPRIRELPG